MESETLRIISDFGALAVLSLFIIVGGFSLKMVVNLISEKVIPLASNHLEHVNSAFDRLAVSYERQTEELGAHNELTKSLVKQVKLQNEILTREKKNV